MVEAKRLSAMPTDDSLRPDDCTKLCKFSKAFAGRFILNRAIDEIGFSTKRGESRFASSKLSVGIADPLSAGADHYNPKTVRHIKKAIVKKMPAVKSFITGVFFLRNFVRSSLLVPKKTTMKTITNGTTNIRL